MIGTSAYAHGEVLRKVPQEQLVDQLFREIDAWIALACLA